jgi:hypothetical protein
MADNPTIIEPPEVDAAVSPDSQQGRSGTGGGSRKPKMITLGKPFLGGANITGVLVSKKEVAPPASVRLRVNDAVTVSGGGLVAFPNWKFFRKNGTKKEILHFISRDDKGVTFTVTKDFADYFSSDEGTMLTFATKDRSSFFYLPVVFLFGGESLEQERAKGAAGQRVNANAAPGRGSGGSSSGPTALMMDAMGAALAGVGSPFMMNSDRNGKRKSLDEALKSGDKKKIEQAVNNLKDLGDADGLRQAVKTAPKEYVGLLNEAIYDINQQKIISAEVEHNLSEIADSVTIDDFDGGEEQQADNGINEEWEQMQQQERLKQATDTVGEHIYKNNLIADRGTRDEVLAVLQSGDREQLDNLSAAGKLALQGVMSSEVLAQAGGSVLAQAFSTVNSSISGNTQTRVSQETGGRVSGGGGTVTTQVSGGGGSARVEGRTEGEVRATEQTTVQSSGGGGGGSARVEEKSQSEISATGRATALVPPGVAGLSSFSPEQKKSAASLSQNISAHASAKIDAIAQADLQGSRIYDDPERDPAVAASIPIINEEINSALNDSGLTEGQKQELKLYLTRQVPVLVWQKFATDYSEKSREYGEKIPWLKGVLSQPARQEPVAPPAATAAAQPAGQQNLNVTEELVGRNLVGAQEQEKPAGPGAGIDGLSPVSTEPEQGVAPATPPEVGVPKGTEVPQRPPVMDILERNDEALNELNLGPKKGGPRAEEPGEPVTKEIADENQQTTVKGPEHEAGEAKGSVGQPLKRLPGQTADQAEPGGEGSPPGGPAEEPGREHLPQRGQPEKPLQIPAETPEREAGAAESEAPEEATDKRAGAGSAEEENAVEEEKENAEGPQSQAQPPGGAQGAAASQAAKGGKSKEALIKQAVDLVNPAMNGFLIDGAIWVWAVAIPSFGTSVLLGALIGDLLAVFKKRLIESALNKVWLAKTIVGDEVNADEIADQIEFSMGVKANVAAMNMVAAVLIVGVIIFTGAAAYLGCTFPLGQTLSAATNYQASILGVAGLGDVCKALTNLSSSGLNGTLNGTPTNTIPAGSCNVAPSGDATPGQLALSCFGSNMNIDTTASIVAMHESTGNPANASKSDKCLPGGQSVSFGLFQINITNHKINGLNCPAAFDYPAGTNPREYDANNKYCTIIDQNLYNSCVTAAETPQYNIQAACQISSNGTNWGAWLADINACGISKTISPGT